MRGVNKVILVAHVAREPEVRYTAAGKAVCNLNVSTSESWRDKATGQMQEAVEFHRVVMYEKLAEVAGEYLKKGAKVYIEGSLHTRKWQDKQTGQDKYSTEIKANTMQMLDSKPQSFDAPAPAQAAAGQAPAQSPQDDFDDDIPF